MKRQILTMLTAAAILLMVSLVVVGQGKGQGGGNGGGGGGGGGTEPTAGNNLSYPVIWSDDNYKKVLRGTPGMVPITSGSWWWWWGVIEGSEGSPDVPLSCAPDPDNNDYCDDGRTGLVTGSLPGVGYPADALRKAYLQKNLNNTWQAQTTAALLGTSVDIDWIDWGDDLESKDWNLQSMVRIEHVLNEAVEMPMTEYVMRHTSGWGTDEAHGLSVLPAGQTVETVNNTLPTVFSACARLTIQRLTVTRDDPAVNLLVWDPTTRQWTGSGINAPIFNKAVYEAADGPGFYNAEINVKGKIIYGYTWTVKTLNQGVGDYRITFSFDSLGCPALKNTFITTGTQIVQPEEEVVLEAEPDLGGGVGVLKPDLNLTYMDIRLTNSKGGGGKRRK